ncbi:hypothetical protein BpHYR1_033549 [Brachionus plicatilis]|uniref:Uncharacterized protein n=1 Tax=Brachionus plicatilis TaxID=10195 RepID=A0A3M7T2S4_BRAPC|nr:hypothetical protein BpHYR1_033549 [Brachionus plicatilis]
MFQGFNDDCENSNPNNLKLVEKETVQQKIHKIKTTYQLSITNLVTISYLIEKSFNGKVKQIRSAVIFPKDMSKDILTNYASLLIFVSSFQILKKELIRNMLPAQGTILVIELNDLKRSWIVS